MLKILAGNFLAVRVVSALARLEGFFKIINPLVSKSQPTDKKAHYIFPHTTTKGGI